MKPKDAQRPDRHTTVFQITPPRAFRYDTLVIAVGSVTNDFGTPGASQYAVPLETPVQAMRFNRHLVNADESPTVIDGIRPRKSGSQLTPRWRKPDSNSQSHPRERVSFGDKPTQIPKAMSWQTNGRRRP